MRLKFKIKLDGVDHEWGFVDGERDYALITLFRGNKETYNYKEMEEKLRLFIGKLSSDGEEIYDKDKVLVKVSANYSMNAWKGIVQYNSELCRFEIALLNRTYGKRVFGFDEIEEIYIIKK